MLTKKLLNQLIINHQPWTDVRRACWSEALIMEEFPPEASVLPSSGRKTLGHHRILSPPASNSAHGFNWPSFPTRAIFGQKIWTVQVLDGTRQRDQWPLMGRVEATNCVLVACSSPAFTGHFVRHSGQFSLCFFLYWTPELRSIIFHNIRIHSVDMFRIRSC